MAHHSIILENKLHAHHKTHLHTMKFNDTRPVRLLLIKILFFRPPKCSLVPKESTLSSHRILGQNCCGRKALNPSFLRKTCMASVLNMKKKWLADYESCCLCKRDQLKDQNLLRKPNCQQCWKSAPCKNKNSERKD